MSTNRREFIRCPITAAERIVLSAAGQEFVGRLLDTSTGGFCIELAEGIAIQREEKYELRINSSSCQVQVIHVDADGSSTRIGLARLTDMVDDPTLVQSIPRRRSFYLPKPKWDLLAVPSVVAILFAMFAGWDLFGGRIKPANLHISEIRERATHAPAAIDSPKPTQTHASRRAPRQVTTSQPKRERGAVSGRPGAQRQPSAAVAQAFADFEAIESPATVAALKLTAQQKQQIRLLLRGLGRRLAELHVSAIDTSADCEEIIDRALLQLEDVLDGKQKALWAQLRGRSPAAQGNLADGLVGSSH